MQKTVEQMDENAADKCLKRLAKDTAELAAETEQARSQGHVHASNPPVFGNAKPLWDIPKT